MIELLIDALNNNEMERNVVSYWTHTSKTLNTEEKIISFYSKISKIVAPDLIIYDPFPFFYLSDILLPKKKIHWSINEISPFSETFSPPLKSLKEVATLELEFEGSYLEKFRDALISLKNKVDTPLSIMLPSPLLVAQLISSVNLGLWLNKDPSMLSRALKPITTMFSEYAVEAIEAGVESIFYLTPLISSNPENENLSRESYLLKGWKIDKFFLSSIIRSNDTIIIKHVTQKKGLRALLDIFDATLSKGFINWDYEYSSPSLFEEELGLDSPLVGGFYCKDLEGLDEERIFNVLQQFNEKFSGRNNILGTGCSLKPDVNLKFVKNIVKKAKNFKF